MDYRTLRGMTTTLCTAVLGISLAAPSAALPLPVRPIDLGDGLHVSGTLVTDDVSGDIVDWQVAVRSVTRVAHYTRANSASLSVDQVTVSGDGQRLSVATSSDPVTLDGGQLAMRSPHPFQDFGVTLADFTGANADGGQAAYMAGASFDFLALGAASGIDYTVATRGAGQNVYDLLPLSFSDGSVLSGSVVTDGTLGALGIANVLGWDLYVDQVFEDLFDKSNSVMSAQALAFDTQRGALTVDNPGGLLSFNKPPLGGRAHALTLADFTDDAWRGGKAAYAQGRLTLQERALGAGRGAWRITGVDSVPVAEPASLALSLGALLCAMGLGSRRPRHDTLAV